MKPFISQLLDRRGEKNPFWKGEKAKTKSIKEFLYLNKPKPQVCERCGKGIPRDLFPLSNPHSRNLKDWAFICRSCNRKPFALEKIGVKRYYNKLKKTKEYYQNHKQKIREWSKKYKQEHKEELKLKRKRYMQEHKEEIRLKKMEYYQKHKKEIKLKRKAKRKIIKIQNIKKEIISEKRDWNKLKKSYFGSLTDDKQI